MVQANSSDRKISILIRRILVRLLKYLTIWICVTIVVILLVLGSVTSFFDLFFEKKLGDGFIVSCKSIVKNCDDQTQYIIIPPVVTATNANERWIVAETENLDAVYRNDSSVSSGGRQYWIVDKKAPVYEDYYHVLKTKYRDYKIVTSGLYGPFDSISFDEELKKRGINLDV